MGATKPKKYNPTQKELAIIRDNYDGSTVKINKIMRLLEKKYPRWYVRKLAGELGLARTKEARWSAAEEQYIIDHYPQMGMKKLQAGILRLSGIKRSYTAIWLKTRRLDMISNEDDSFTLRGLCNFFWSGQENHSIVYRWIDAGWLKAKRRGTLRKKSNGGDQWYFAPEWIRNFIIAHPEEIDLRLVDRIPFIKLLASGSACMELCVCKCPRCGQEHEMKLFNPGIVTPRIYCPTCKETVSNTYYDIAESAVG
ncbi:MAG: hypothetical protein ABFD59_00250 [Smithella sp.]